MMTEAEQKKKTAPAKKRMEVEDHPHTYIQPGSNADPPDNPSNYRLHTDYYILDHKKYH